jgi:hypothetical protein
MALGVTQLAWLGYIVHDWALAGNSHWQVYVATYTYLVAHLLATEYVRTTTWLAYHVRVGDMN